MKNVPLRRTFLVAGAFVAASAMALTCASGATAATNPGTNSSAQAGIVRLGTGGPLATPKVSSVWLPGHIGAVRNSTSEGTQLGGQSVLKVGVAAATSVAMGPKSWSCTGVLAPGATLQVGTTPDGCKPYYNKAPGGVGLDLSALTSSLPSQLPAGLGVSLTAKGIIANARFVNGVTSGVGRIDQAALNVCVGLTVSGSCVGLPVVVPITLSGTVNEDLVTKLVQAVTRTPALTAVAQQLSNALRQLVSIRTNVQSVNPTTKVRTVTALQVKLAGNNTPVIALAVATAGPNS